MEHGNRSVAKGDKIREGRTDLGIRGTGDAAFSVTPIEEAE